jgi:hypothetical protein
MKTLKSVLAAFLIIFTFYIINSCDCNDKKGNAFTDKGKGSISAAVVWAKPVPPCGDDWPPDTCLTLSIYDKNDKFVSHNYVVFKSDDYPPDTVNLSFSKLTFGQYRLALEQIDKNYLDSDGEIGTKEVISWYTGQADTLDTPPDEMEAMIIELTPEQPSKENVMFIIY